jgi:Ca-activated chloride channel homolog
MSFLTPLGLLGAGLAIPIILLYMLRLRRREVTISSTFLWQQILQDNEANTPWQKLKRNLLLFLQLLILACIVLALARPFMIVPAVGTGQIALLLDASASMNATDISGDSRFEEAKRRALEIVETMSAADTMTVIRVSNVPEVLAPATADRAVLRAAINNAQPSQAKADWDAALTLARAGASNAESFSTVIVGDGGLGDNSQLPDMPGEVNFVPIGESSSNVAITALATRNLPGQPPQLFAQVTNYGDQDAEIIFDLRVDGALFTAERYTIPANDGLPLVSAALPDDFEVLQAGITLPGDATFVDYLAEDNTAWAVSSGGSNRRALLMTPGNLFVEQVLRSLPGVQSFKGNVDAGLPTEAFDFYIFDGWLPEDLPAGDLLIINPPRSTSFFSVSGESEETANPQVKRDDPRVNFVDFENVNLLKFKQVSDANWAEALITVEGGPLLLAGEIDGRQVAILTFDVHDSDLPVQITWPILVSNLLEWFTPRDAIYAPDGLAVGDSLAINPPFTADTVRVARPDGSQREIPIERETLVYAETNQVGVYRVDVLENGEVIQSLPFAVDLFAVEESDITPRTSIQIGAAVITPEEQEEVGQREFWPWVALLALLILLIEWYVYHQRLRAPTVFRPVLRRNVG